MAREVSHYSGRITPWHSVRPKFRATVEMLTAPYVAMQEFLETLPHEFDIDFAIGKQLDVVGEWVGRARFIEFPLPDPWFSYDDKRRGWDIGIWKNESYQYQTTAMQELDDETYRRLLYAKILSNNWDGTTIGARQAYELFFADIGSRVLVVDFNDLKMTVGVAGHVPQNVFLSLLANDYLPLKPGGVKLDTRIVSVEGYSLFGFDVDNEYVKGWDQGAWGVKPEYIVRHGPILPEGLPRGWALDTFGDDLMVWIDLDNANNRSFSSGVLTSVTNIVTGLPLIITGNPGFDGNSIIFDGVDDRLEIWSVPIGSDSYSCFASASLDPVGAASAAKLAILQTAESILSTDNLFSVSLLGRDGATKALRTDRNSSNLSSIVDLIDDVLSQVGVIYDAGKPTLYVNGVVSGPAAWTQAGEIGRVRLFVGANAAGGDRWKGRLREMIILKRVPTAAEMTVIRSNLGKV